MNTITVQRHEANYDTMRALAIELAKADRERRGVAGYGSAEVHAAVRKDGTVSKVWTETSIYSPCTRAVFEAALADATRSGS